MWANRKMPNYYIGYCDTTTSGISYNDMVNYVNIVVSGITISGTDYYDFEGQGGIVTTESGRVVVINNEYIDGGVF